MTTREWIKHALARSIQRNAEDASSTRQLRWQLAEIANDLPQNPSDELHPQQQDKCPDRAPRKATFIGLLMLIIFFIFPILSIALSLSNGETPPGGGG